MSEYLTNGASSRQASQEPVPLPIYRDEGLLHRNRRPRTERRWVLDEIITTDEQFEQVKARFFSRVHKRGPRQPHMDTRCWEWWGGKGGDDQVAKGNRKGYGKFHITPRGGNLIGAHQFSWLIHCGDIEPGQKILHRCDNPSCVRPSHLWIGSHAENMKDASKKGRWGNNGRRRSGIAPRRRQRSRVLKPLRPKRVVKYSSMRSTLALDVLASAMFGSPLECLSKVQLADPCGSWCSTSRASTSASGATSS